MTVKEFVDNFNKKKNEKKATTNHKSFDKLIRNTPTKSLEDLKKEGDEAYAEKIASDASLLEAYKAKKLKSKENIKQARYLLAKEKEKEEKEKAAQAEKVAASIEVVEG